MLKRKKTLIKNTKERDGKDFGYFLDASKITKDYNWRNKTSLEQGLIETIDWIKDNLDIINKLNLKYKHKKWKKFTTIQNINFNQICMSIGLFLIYRTDFFQLVLDSLVSVNFVTETIKGVSV